MRQRKQRVKCPKCGSGMKLTINGFEFRRWNKGKPLTLEHINVNGEGSLTFNSENDLKRYCRENKVASNALL